MAWSRLPLWSLAGLLAGSGCAVEPGKAPPVGPFHYVCTVPGFALPALTDDLVAELERHGISAFDGGGDLGSRDIIIEGSWRDLFRARDLILKGMPDRGWIVWWPADYCILPGSEEWETLRNFGRGELPAYIRIARVVFELTLSQWILQILEQEGFHPLLYLGSSGDLVFVPNAEAAAAAELLAGNPFTGVRSYPFDPAEY